MRVAKEYEQRMKQLASPEAVKKAEKETDALVLAVARKKALAKANAGTQTLELTPEGKGGALKRVAALTAGSSSSGGGGKGT